MTSFSTTDAGIDRKSLKQPDSLSVVLKGFFDNLFKHYRGAAILIGALFILGLIGAFAVNHWDSRTEAGKTALFLAQKSLETELKAIADSSTVPADAMKLSAAKAKNTIGKDQVTDTAAEKAAAAAASAAAIEAATYKKLDVDAQFPETLKKLKALEQDYGKTRPAFDARLKLGDLYFQHGAFDKALPWYKKAAETAPGHFEKTLALSSLAYLNENAGKLNEAIQSYQQAIDIGEVSLKGDLLLGLARCYEAIHDSAKARSIYDKIITDLPNSEFAKSAELYKGMLE